jgi:hypothetical protein
MGQGRLGGPALAFHVTIPPFPDATGEESPPPPSPDEELRPEDKGNCEPCLICGDLAQVRNALEGRGISFERSEKIG